MRLERLEARDCPALDIGGGVVQLDTGTTLSVYGPGWVGGLNVAATPDAVYVGPQGGGGPRLATLDPATGARLVGDVFVGDPADRSGLIPLLVGIKPTTPEAPVSIGTGYTIYLSGADADMTRRTAEYFAPLADVIRVTNARPDIAPGGYLTVAFGAPVGWAGYGNAVGVGALGIVGIGAGGITPDEVYVAYPGVDGLPVAALVAAHEADHAFGLGHSDDPNDVMYFQTGPNRTFSAAELAFIRGVAVRATPPNSATPGD